MKERGEREETLPPGSRPTAPNDNTQGKEWGEETQCVSTARTESSGTRKQGVAGAMSRHEAASPYLPVGLSAVVFVHVVARVECVREGGQGGDGVRHAAFKRRVRCESETRNKWATVARARSKTRGATRGASTTVKGERTQTVQ